jgi:hypothetical protein
MRARFIVGAFVLLFAFGAGNVHGAGDPYAAQADQVPCPTPSRDWHNVPSARSVLTPNTISPDGSLIVYFAAPIVQISCVYRTPAGKDVSLTVRYALPIDVNPWADFDIGCTSTHPPAGPTIAAKAWNAQQRVYRVIGAKTWSLATFIDDLNQLKPTDVPRFETMARLMLKGVQPFAHNCSLAGNGNPVQIKSLWTFSFSAHTTHAGVTSSGGTSGSFSTAVSSDGTTSGSLSNLSVPDFRLRVSGGGKSNVVSIHVASPIGFSHGYGAALRANVVVIASNDAGCQKGAKGTLLVATPYLSSPKVQLAVCGHSYLNGSGSVTAFIKSV